MRLFVTHMHDFTPLRRPVISFSKGSVIEDLCYQIGKNEFLAYVASRECERKERIGRLIGLAKIKNRNVVLAESLIAPEAKDDKCFRNGAFRWPQGVEIGEAWLFRKPPKAKPLIGSQFSRAPQGGFYILEDQAKVAQILASDMIKQDMSQAYRPHSHPVISP